MGAVAKSGFSYAGRVIGIIPQFMVDVDGKVSECRRDVCCGNDASTKTAIDW